MEPKPCGTVTGVDETSESVLAAALRARGGRVTPQRLAIARVVREQQGHVTAEDVFGQVSERMPGVSLPTVYATLELLEQLGLVRRVPAASGAILFDPRTDEHDHLICRRCGAVADLETQTDRSQVFTAATKIGFHPDEAQVVVTGLCADCAAAQAAVAAQN